MLLLERDVIEVPRVQQTTLVESYNKIKAMLKKIRDRLPQLTGSQGRPTLPALVRQFEHALKKGKLLKARVEKTAHIEPPQLDPNLLAGHQMLTQHADRLPSKPWAEKMAAGGQADSSIESPKGPSSTS